MRMGSLSLCHYTVETRERHHENKSAFSEVRKGTYSNRSSEVKKQFSCTGRCPPAADFPEERSDQGNDYWAAPMVSGTTWTVIVAKV